MKKVGLKMSESQIKKDIFEKIDLNKDNKISFHEFLYYSEHRKKML